MLVNLHRLESHHAHSDGPRPAFHHHLKYLRLDIAVSLIESKFLRVLSLNSHPNDSPVLIDQQHSHEHTTPVQYKQDHGVPMHRQSYYTHRQVLMHQYRMNQSPNAVHGHNLLKFALNCLKSHPVNKSLAYRSESLEYPLIGEYS
ncbi:hypothetical protein D3C80_1178440 [compost metagenome]